MEDGGLNVGFFGTLKVAEVCVLPSIPSILRRRFSGNVTSSDSLPDITFSQFPSICFQTFTLLSEVVCRLT
jgi:hypothetical protein